MATTLDEAKAFAVKRIEWSWTSDATGNATATTTQGYWGQVLTLVTIPGSPLPSDQYDITIKDVDGYDVLQGNGTNLGNSTVQYRATNLSSAVFGNLTLSVQNAGNATQGQAILYVR
jgi:hypothetical protein